MRTISSFLKYFTLLTLFITQQVFANDKISEGEVYSYLELSGLKASIQGMPAQIQSMSQQMQLTSKDPAKDKIMMSALLDTWQEEKINKKIISALQAQMSKSEMTELLTWLNSDLVKSVKLEETKATLPDFQQELMGYMAGIQANPPTAKRQQLARAFIDNTKMAENGVEIAMAIIENMFNSMKIAMPEKKIPEAQMQQQLSQMRGMMTQMMDQQMMMTSYYLYKDVSDANLEQYIDFYKKPLGQKEIKVVYGAFIEGMKVWGDDIAQVLTAAIKDKVAS
ncbi:MAG: hypothetical protein ACSHW0_05925 [Thalassotalea sp.]